jgi:ribosomal-protein-alanine N-acetyltransferase
MPQLVEPALASGTLRAIEQPRLTVDAELTCRPWRPDDAGAVVAAFDDPDIQRWHTRRMAGVGEAREWVAHWTAGWVAETETSWAIARTADDRVVGQVGLRTVSLAAGVAQLSYWVLPGARGRAVACRAAHAVTRWSFDTVGLYRLTIMHSVHNPASCRVARAAGFPVEGTMRGYLRHGDGWHDTHVHGRLRGDTERRPRLP